MYDMDRSKNTDLYIITSDESPPLTDAQKKSLQNELGTSFEVKHLTVNEVIEAHPTKGILWPYFRGIPSTKNDILSVLSKDEGQSLSIINNYETSPDVSNKRENHLVAERNGIPTPKSQGVDSDQDIEKLPFNYPLVIKGYPSGRGEDVFLCENFEDARNAYKSIKKKGLNAIGQEYIEESRGMDLRVLVVNRKIALCLKRKGSPGSFLSNVSQGGSYEKYELSEEDKKTINAVIESFPLDVAGIDFLFSDKGLLFNEINLSPGWSGTAEAIVPFLVELIEAKKKVLDVLEEHV